MPPPATVPDLLDLVQKSGVADEARFKAYVARMTTEGAFPKEPAKVAGLLVRDAILTYFQAEQILQGKWKRFSIGKYKVLEKLGAGGMGQVFLCEHKLMRRRVAVKVLPTAKAADEASLGRFYREARAVAAVDHPNIVRAYDIDQDENLHFLVMEYVDGTNLQDLVKKHSPVSVLRCCHYIYGSAVGLQHAHEIGLVHRDIKPGNILIDRAGVVKILDMGLARFFHDVEDDITRQYDENILGTADYLSPEQAEDSHGVDIRTDIYSLGATFYFMLTGSQPFPEGTIAQKLIWHKSREPRPVQSLRPEVPDDVVAVVKRMMAKDPADRYQTPAEVMAALAPWAATPIAPPPDREMPQLSPVVLGGATNASRNAAAAAQRLPTFSPAPAGDNSGSGVRVSQSPSMASAPTIAANGHASPGSGGTKPDGLPTIPVDHGQAVWDSIEEAPVPAGDDIPTMPTKPAEPKSDRRLPGSTRKKSRRPILYAVGAVLAVGAVAGGYLLLNRKPADVSVGPPTAGKRLTVTKAKSGAENSFPTVAAAVRAAGPGDTIAIADPSFAEPTVRFDRRTRDVTIESGLPGGKPVVVEFSSAGGGAGAVAMADLGGAEGVRFRNVEFDGKGVADYAAQVTGNAPGVTFENVTVRNVKKAGFLLQNVAGVAGRPVTLDRVRVLLSPGNDAGVKFEAAGTLPTRHAAVKNSRFEGPADGLGKVGVRFDGAATDVEVSGNRVYRVETAFAFGPPPLGQPVRVQLTQNTVFEAPRAGVVFNGPGKFEVAVTRNYFARTRALALQEGGPVEGVTSADNGYDPDSQPGSLSLTATKYENPRLAAPNPDDDATFLRFQAGTAPAKIGAN